MSNTTYADTLKAIREYLPEKGVFVEAGAVDGVFESNTYWLERFDGWTGLLIEPSEEMHSRLRFNRPKSRSFHCALVSHNENGTSLHLVGTHATASVELSTRRQPPKGSSIVLGRSLSSILDETNLPTIDFLSLDVEGFELNALRGIDFSRHMINVILVECLSQEAFDQIKHYLAGHGYRLEKKITYRDYLFLASSQQSNSSLSDA